jgi:ABC-type multidrug transport system ATPase subunit
MPVRETLTYAARLRLPTDLTGAEIELIVEQTLDELGLRDAADTVVGGPLRKGISGGERRRLSIGCVLVTLPSVLILDEPTSGLDAFTSYLLLQTLSALARRGRTVILSIHAPRSDAFPLFDRITLLSKGRVVYSGLRRDCLGWFSGLGHDVEPGINPLDFLIDVSSVDNRTPESEEASGARVRALTNAWAAHIATKPDTLAPRPVLTTPRRSAEGEALHRVVTRGEAKRPGFFLQTRVLTARAHRNVYRNLPQVIGLAMQGIILGVIVGVTYANLPDTPTGIQSLKNLSFQMVPGVFYLQQVFWVYKFCKDLVIFDREREDNLYDVVPYVLSDWISFLFPAILSPTLYIIILWFIAGMRHDDVARGLFTVIGSTLLVQCAIQGLALFVSSVTRSFPQASLIGNAINIFQLLSAGFILVDPPDYAEWIRWLSPYFYSFRIVATVVFKDRVFACPPTSEANLAQCDGNNVLRSFNFDLDLNIGVWFAGLIAFALFEYALACVALRYLPVGGVRHASEIDSHFRGKTADVADSHMARDRIDVAVRHLSFAWERRGRGIAKNARRPILDDVSASFPAGEVSAILGPSGAGKSTLLQLIAGRRLGAGALAGFARSGDLLFAGAPATPVAMSNVAFVEQEDDWHLPNLTVRETLRYAAILRLPNEMPRRHKVGRAETVLRMLGLKDCADLPVGGPLIKGISGGEKRRLSLAVQSGYWS